MSNQIEARIAKLTAEIEARTMPTITKANYREFEQLARVAELNAVAAYEREYLQEVASDLADPDCKRVSYCTRQRENAIQRLINRQHYDRGEEQALRNVIDFLDTYIRFDIERDFPEA